jgi:demethoxyubiquinone hydroxylase (CLK1/Coq7/Cat5 family)
MVISDIQLYEILSAKLGREEARVLTEYVETKVEKQLNDKTTVFATKEDLVKEVSTLRIEMHEMEVRITRNIFVAGVVQFLAIVGSVLMLLKFHGS